MKNRSLLIYVILLAGFHTSSLLSQNVVASSGGDASGAEGSISYTVGQLTYTTTTSTTGSLSQGVQQPFVVTVVAGIERADIKLECIVYPNPTTDLLNITIDTSDTLRYAVVLLDVDGKLVARDDRFHERPEAAGLKLGRVLLWCRGHRFS